MTATPSTRVRFGAFELDLRTGELLGQNRTMVLQEQPFRVVQMLIERAGQIATRDEIQRELWPNDTVVEFDHAINTVIGNLRRALGDTVAKPKYIETVARRGYRLIASIERIQSTPPLPQKSVVMDAGGSDLTLPGSSLVGKKVSHYRVLRVLGGGGMGLVYEAEDIKLGRRVALKFLPEELGQDAVALKRFEREARTASALSHPHICTIYEVDDHGGQPFIAMELLEGQTLRDLIAANRSQPMAVAQLLDIALQFCEGLEAAHEKGIIHRDIKPANIFMTRSGQVKILDFGLAKLATLAEGSHSEDDTIADVRVPERTFEKDSHLTRTHQTMGTVGYMSPEQIRGEKLDGGSDIFSFGLVLYELAARERAFGGSGVGEIQEAILKQSLTPLRERNPAVPEKFEQMVARMLEKDRTRRPQSAAELLVELKELKRHHDSGAMVSLAAAPARSIRSLAVLPLVNLSGDPQQDYFADGMTEELTMGLAQISALRVVSRTSANRYKGTNRPILEIARELGVEAIVEGSVLRSDNRVRVTAQLIDAASDTHLWARSYERDLQDVLRLQNEIARAVASEIQLRLTPAEEQRLSQHEVLDPAAHDDYLRGQVLAAKRTGPDQWRAISFFQSAIRRHPNFVPAYIDLADVHRTLALNSNVAPGEVFPVALAAARTALELDPQRAEAHVVLAVVTAEYEWNWVKADEEFQIALRLNPNSMWAHTHYGHFLGRWGESDKAVHQARIGSELDPLDPRGAFLLGVCLYQARRFSEAATLFRTGTELYPNFWPMRLYLGKTLLELGQHSKALKELGKVSDFTAEPVATMGCAYARIGREAEARKILEGLKLRATREYISASQIARLHGALGEKDEAFAWLEKAYVQRDTWLTFLQADAINDPIRSDPRFTEMLRRVGFRHT